MRVNIDEANREAVDRVLRSQPVLVGVAPAIEWPRMSGPLRGAVIGGLIFEGLAPDEPAAVAMVEAGEVAFAPCHHHQNVGPMGGGSHAAMAVYLWEDAAWGDA